MKQNKVCTILGAGGPVFCKEYNSFCRLLSRVFGFSSKEKQPIASPGFVAELVVKTGSSRMGQLQRDLLIV